MTLTPTLRAWLGTVDPLHPDPFGTRKQDAEDLVAMFERGDRPPALRTLGGKGSGNFGHAGRPGEVGGSSVGSKVEEAERLISKAMGTSVTHPDGRSWRVSVGDEAPVLRAAPIVASTLAEMRAKGYVMPYLVKIEAGREGHESVSATTLNSGVNSTMNIYVPPTIPDDVSLDDAVYSTVANDSAVEKFSDLVVHEMGHVQFDAPTTHSVLTDPNFPLMTKRDIVPYDDKEHPWVDNNTGELFRTKPTSEDPEYNAVEGRRDAMQKAQASVSDYAKTNLDEFAAEAFVRLYRGEKLTPEAQKLYDYLNGPKVR